MCPESTVAAPVCAALIPKIVPPMLKDVEKIVKDKACAPVCTTPPSAFELAGEAPATCAECAAGVRELQAVAERLDLAGVAATRVAAALCFVPPQYSAWEGRLEVLDCKRRVETRVLDGARRLGDFAARDPAGACQRC